MVDWQTVSTDPYATETIGCRLGSLLHPGDVVFLLGELGTGKTCLAQGIVRGLGGGRARSPSFALVNRYQTRAKVPIYHCDLYRLHRRREVEDLDLFAAAEDGVLLIEWAELAAPEFPERLELELTYLPDRPEARMIGIKAAGARYERLAGELKQLVVPRV